MTEVPYMDRSGPTRIVWIDENTGALRTEEVSETQFQKQKFFGTAQKIRTLSNGPEWFALTNEGDDVFFFRSGRFIPLFEPPCTAEVNDCVFVSRFRLVTEDQVLMSFLYFNPFSHPLRLLDCMYDYLNRIGDDLLYSMGDSLRDGRWGPEDADIPLWRDEIEFPYRDSLQNHLD